MKRLLMTVCISMVVISGWLMSAANAGEVSKKTQWVGVNPLGLVFNMYGGHYGRYVKDGAADITVPFFFWNPTEDCSMIGVGAKYHIYKDGDGKGVFYGGGDQVMRVNWDYTKTEQITATTFTPQGEVGYRWIWGKNKELTIAPSMAAGVTMGEVKSNSGVAAEYGSAGFSWQLGIGLAYMF